jgi:tRNA threonylcarbamoyl adenosine modification protein YjeE
MLRDVGPVYELLLPDVAATQRLGTELAAELAASEVLAIDGELGSGKTTLIRAIVAGLGGDPELVSSPTFTLINRYQARLPIVHLDAYRLRDGSDLAALGFDELLEESVVLIEWASRVRPALSGCVRWDALIEHHPPGRRARLQAPPGKRLQLGQVTGKLP